MSSDEEQVSARRPKVVDDDSDDEDAPVSRTKKTVANVFGSDSESDGEGRASPRRKSRSPSPAAKLSDAEARDYSVDDAAPRKRVLKRKAALSDEEEEDVEKDIFGSDSEDDAPVSKKKRGRGSESEEEEEPLSPLDESPTRKRARDVFGSSESEAERSDREDDHDVFGSGSESEREIEYEEERGGSEPESRENPAKNKKQRGEGKKSKKRRYSGEEAPPKDDKPKSLIKQQIEEEKMKKMAKKQQADEQAVEAWVQKMINDMKVAAELDREANLNRKPGINKLKMLPLVEEELRIKGEKRGRRSDAEVLDRQELYIENGVLTMIAQWLEPLPDKSLPAVQIRTALLQALDDLPVDRHRDELKESMVGQRIMLLSRHPKEVFDNKQRCQHLITKWSRQVCGLSTDYRALSRDERREISKRERDIMEERRQRALARGVVPQRRESTDNSVNTTDLAEALEGGQRGPKPGEAGWRRHAMIPQKTGRDYFVSPVGDEAPENIKKKKGPSRVDLLQRRVKDLKSKSKINPLNKMSVEGRGL